MQLESTFSRRTHDHFAEAYITISTQTKTTSL